MAFGNVRVAGGGLGTAPDPVPVRVMMCGAPGASSLTVTEPLKAPGADGVKVTDIEQLPAAGTLDPQLSVSAKLAVLAIVAIVNEALPILRRRTDCGWLVEPICTGVNCKEKGFMATEGAEPMLIFDMNASLPPASCDWKAPAVTGKSVELVKPKRYRLPLPSRAMLTGASILLPPKYVENN